MNDSTTQVIYEASAIEARAQELCNASRGAGAWERKGCKRAHWRTLALLEVELGPEDFARLRGKGRSGESMLLRHLQRTEKAPHDAIEFNRKYNEMVKRAQDKFDVVMSTAPLAHNRSDYQAEPLVKFVAPPPTWWERALYVLRHPFGG
jgi:hypothetical protein